VNYDDVIAVEIKTPVINSNVTLRKKALALPAPWLNPVARPPEGGRGLNPHLPPGLLMGFVQNRREIFLGRG
jgi:hypothetical protein